MSTEPSIPASKLRVGTDGRIHRRRVKKYPNGTIYDCEFVDGKPDGYGCLTDTSGMKYTGSFSNGLFHGHAKVTWVDSSNKIIKTFQGEYKHGKRCGSGILQEINGDKWEGQFENDKFHGLGTLWRGNGEVLKGAWKNGKLHCENGSISFQNGDKYEGSIQLGKLHGGMGHYTYKIGGFYTGNFVSGVKHGIGTRRYFDKTTYRGDFYEDKLSGHGTISYVNDADNRTKYCGGWKDGMHDTYGELFFDKSSEIEFYKGGFHRGYFQGTGYLRFRDGTYYEGSFLRGQRDGHGRRVWKEGNYFEGEWKNGSMVQGCYVDVFNHSTYVGTFERDKKNGAGTETWRSPKNQPFRDPVFGWLHKNDAICKYSGEYLDGYIHGEGNFEASNGRKYEGSWKFGKPHGLGSMILLCSHEHGDASRMNIGQYGSLYRPLKYIGGWKDGKRHGQGKLIYLDDTSKEVNYDNGVVIQ